MNIEAKWKAELKVKKTFTKEEIEEFNRDKRSYVAMNPGWRNQIN